MSNRSISSSFHQLLDILWYMHNLERIYQSKRLVPVQMYDMELTFDDEFECACRVFNDILGVDSTRVSTDIPSMYRTTYVQRIVQCQNLARHVAKEFDRVGYALKRIPHLIQYDENTPVVIGQACLGYSKESHQKLFNDAQQCFAFDWMCSIDRVFEVDNDRLCLLPIQPPALAYPSGNLFEYNENLAAGLATTTLRAGHHKILGLISSYGLTEIFPQLIPNHAMLEKDLASDIQRRRVERNSVR